MNSHRIIRRPLVTEKTSAIREVNESIIAFEVDPDANKIEIRRAVEELFKVKVAEVRIATVRGKMKRLGRNIGKRRDWKKAYIRLQPGEKAPDFFEGV